MKGGVACMVLAAEVLASLGVPLAGRPDREHRHGGGVDRRRRAGDGARAAGRRRDRPGAERVRRLDRLPRQPAAAHHRAGPGGPRRHRAAASRPGRRGERDREDGHRARGGAAAARGVGAAAAAPVPVAGRRVPTIIAGGEWLVSYPAGCALELPHRVPARPGRRARLRRRGSSGSSTTGSRGRRRPTRGWRRTRRRSSGWPARCRRPRCRPTTRWSGGARRGGRGRAHRPPGRPRQLARRRHADGRGRHSGDLPRPGRHPPRAHPRRSGSPIADLVSCAQALAVAAMRFCGVAVLTPATLRRMADYRDVNRRVLGRPRRRPRRVAETTRSRGSRRIPAFLSEVVRFDRPRLGDIRGLDAVHLQCHIGTDTVSLGGSGRASPASTCPPRRSRRRGRWRRRRRRGDLRRVRAVRRRRGARPRAVRPRLHRRRRARLAPRRAPLGPGGGGAAAPRRPPAPARGRTR